MNTFLTNSPVDWFARIEEPKSSAPEHGGTFKRSIRWNGLLRAHGAWVCPVLVTVSVG